MSQHINPTPKQTDIDSVNSKIGNVGSTDLQAQITALNSNFADINTAMGGSSLKFTGTLGGNVITVANSCPIGLTFYMNSNNPTNCPANIGYGSYLFMKANTENVSIFCWDNSHFACVYGVKPKTATSISWNSVK